MESKTQYMAYLLKCLKQFLTVFSRIRITFKKSQGCFSYAHFAFQF